MIPAQPLQLRSIAKLCIAALWLGFAWPLVSTAETAELANRLAGHPSPYLAMHGHDPVAWQDWGAETLALSRTSGRPLFISSGYFACHWCHVMQRESYQQAAIAKLINKHFIPVKLDRELHPALDAYLIDFSERTTGRAGWPLNVFLTPDGHPFLALTYAPPGEFHALLERVIEVWGNQGDEVSRLAAASTAERSRRQSPLAAAEPTPIVADSVAKALRDQALNYGDTLGGGFGHQTRFPMAPHLNALLGLQRRLQDPALGGFLRLTLTRMAERGLRDHLIGGFFRYTVDPDWSTPHFEKMLYTQALMVPLYLRAAEVLDEPRFRAVARETLDFMLRAMAAPGGGYISSLSAVDGDGVEGGGYLWRSEELDRLLSPEQRRIVDARWGLDRPPELEAGSLPRLERSPEEIAEALSLSRERVDEQLAAAREKLIAARSLRSLPRDTKVLAGWNGLVLSALAAGQRAFADPVYRKAGDDLADFLRTRLMRDGALLRARSAAGEIGAPAIEDYAYVARGFHDWAEATEDTELAELARSLALHAWSQFRSDNGWRQSAEPLLPGVPAEPRLSDSPLPAPDALVLGLLIGTEPKATEALQQAIGPIADQPFNAPSLALLAVESSAGETAPSQD